MRLGPVLTLALLLCGTVATPQDQQAGGAAVQPQVQVDPKHQENLKNDVELGKSVAKQIEKELKFSENEEYKERVQRIGQEIAAIANTTRVKVTWGDKRLSPYEYHFFVVKGEDVNAFSVPGGYIYIYEGLVEFSESDDELAGVIAHEVAHASFRHIATMQKEQAKLDWISLGAILAAIWSPRDAGNILVPAGFAIQGVQSGWSVDAEESADFGGLQYIMRSKYNPLGTLTFMERLAYRDVHKPRIDWGIFRTHPPSEERAKTLVGELRALNVPFNRSSVTKSLRATNKIGDTGIELWFGDTKVHVFSGDTAQTRADRASDHLNEFFDRIPALYELQARGQALYGSNRRLFEIEADDAQAQGKSVEKSTSDAVQALKRALFDLAYRVAVSKVG
ncbi:MAG: M48 family metalloprotease [Fimbriimonadaceae bacterium]